MTAGLKAAGIRVVRDQVDAITFQQLRDEIPTNDFRDLTGILSGDPWPNDHRRQRRDANLAASAES